MKHFFIFILLSSFLLQPFCVFSQDNFILEKYQPLPKNLKEIIEVQHTIYKEDTTSEKFSKYSFDKNQNLISWQVFPYHIKETRKYDSLDRIIKIDGLYGESFGNGITTYSYPNKNQKIEIHEKMGFYKYIKSDFIFDKNGKISQEEYYDSTSHQMHEKDTVYRMTNKYNYDDKKNLLEEKNTAKVNGKKIYSYHIKIAYNKGKITHQKVNYYKKNATPNFYNNEEKHFFYILTGKFIGKLEKEVEVITSLKDTIQIENHYTYKILENDIIVKEEKYFNNQILMRYKKYYYKKNLLIKTELYNIQKETNFVSDLEHWTEHTYIFYPKNEE